MRGNHGKTHLSFEQIPERETAVMDNILTRREMQLAGFMRMWLRLPTKSRDMLAAVIVDGSISRSAIARNLRVSPQAIQQRLIGIARKYPQLKTVLRMRLKALRS